MKLKQKIRDFSLSATALRALGLLFLAVGLAGSVIQRRLGVGVLANSELWETIQNSQTAMGFATVALVFQALEACAVPIFVFLLVEGARVTSSYGKYLLRVLVLAFVCEIPYNLAVYGELWTFESLNPVFAMVSCLIMLFFFRQFPGKKARNVVIKIVAVIGVFMWSNIFRISDGACCVLLAFRSFILVSAIFCSSLLLILATLSLWGTPEPFSMLQAFFRRTAAGGDLVMKVKLLSA